MDDAGWVGTYLIGDDRLIEFDYIDCSMLLTTKMPNFFSDYISPKKLRRRGEIPAFCVVLSSAVDRRGTSTVTSLLQ